MRVVFLGTSEFAATILERLAGSGDARPVLVVTRPDRPRGRGRRSASPPVAETSRALGIPLEQPENVNDGPVSARIAQAGPDVVVVCAFGALIKEPLLSERDLLNVHPSLLPRWRGAAPIERAIMAGDERTGVSIMRLTAGLDSGPVCLTATEQIRPGDTYGTLADRLAQTGGALLLKALDLSARGTPAPFVEQDEEGVTYAEKITAADRLLDPARPAVEVERAVRALHPHIGARVALADGTLLGVHGAALLQAEERDDRPDGGPGASAQQPPEGVSAREGRLLLGCRPGTLELLVVQPPGGRAMDASAYLRGHGLPGRR